MLSTLGRDIIFNMTTLRRDYRLFAEAARACGSEEAMLHVSQVLLATRTIEEAIRASRDLSSMIGVPINYGVLPRRTKKPEPAPVDMFSPDPRDEPPTRP